MMKKSLLRRLLAVLVTTAMLVIACSAWASTSVLSWETRDDFEHNGDRWWPTTRKNIDTTGPGIKIGVNKDFVTTATITCVTSANKTYVTGVDRMSVSVLDPATKVVIRTIPLPGRAAGVIYNSVGNKLYVGQYDNNNVTVIDVATDTIIHTFKSGTIDHGAFAAAYNPTNNKVYIANTFDQTVTILDGVSDSVLVTVPVVAGATTAGFDSISNTVYLTSKASEFVTVIDGASDQVADVAIEAPLNLVGGQSPGEVGLRVDAGALGITSADATKLYWKYQLGQNQKIRFQVRTAPDATSLDTARYHGPDGTAESWYETPSVSTETTVDLGISLARWFELQVKLESDGLSSPVLEKVTVVWESYPDLVMSNVTVTPPVAVIGSSVNVSSTVSNPSAVDAPASRTSYHLYKGRELVYTFPESSEVPPLLKNTLPYTGNVNLLIPSVATGDYTLVACADGGKVIAETNEDNNCSGAPISIRSVQPDLVIKKISATVSGGRVNYTVTVKNQGTTAAGEFWVSIYLSPDSGITGAGDDIWSAGTHLWSLRGGEEYTFSGYGSVPANLSGTYYVGGFADSDKMVTEANEDNNGLAENQVTINNDLVVNAVSGTATNGKVNYSVTVKNLGNGVAGEHWVSIYLSPDSEITGAGNDILVANTHVWSVRGDETYTLTGYGNVPANLSGTYYVGALVDSDKMVPESNVANNAENNNALTGNQVTINNDLVVTISATAENGKVNYTVTVTNVGNGVAGEHWTNVYLSADSDITGAGNDIYLAGEHLWYLRGGEVYTFTGSRNVPANLTGIGTYYVGAFADSYNYVPESNKDNNGEDNNISVKQLNL